MKYTRREMLKLTGGVIAAGAVTRSISFASPDDPNTRGLVAGQVRAAEVGNKILRDGGNAVDAAVAAALAAGVAAPPGCGIGGYGGHMVIALKGGKKVTAIDYNSAAPAVARPDMFPLDESGAVRRRVNEYGWLAAGVPGTLAGLQLALDRYGTRPFRQLVAPAIQLAEEGFPITDGQSRAIRMVSAQLLKDAASTRLLFKDGEPLQAGATYRNPDLAKMLGKLAAENSVASFYRGDTGRRIAAEFQRHGGLVTAKDMADYRAREVEPLELKWRGFTIRAAPLTAGGLTVLQALSILKMLDWNSSPAGPMKTQAFVEALRIAWNDRLRMLGDPEKTKVPVGRLLSEKYAREMAARVGAATKERKPLTLKTTSRDQGGTVHLNSADGEGNMVALTLTHGGPFGACVTVDGLGLTLGHGMFRFDVQPAHPNAPGPGKRPLNNMCPTVVLRGGQPVLALGAVGARMIVNAVFNVLAQFVGLDASVEDAIAAPRLHTDGNLDLAFEPKTPEADVEFLGSIGYRMRQIGATPLGANVANAHALLFSPENGVARAVAR
jgi:gamma-glutamyltranspeptidase/glutathione hydrolase